MEIPDRLKGSPFWDKPTSMEELIVVSAGLQTSIKREMQLTPWEMFVAGLIRIGTDGSIIFPGSTSTSFEDPNSAQMSADILEIKSYTRANSNEPTVGGPPTAGQSIAYHKQFAAVEFSLVAGSIANLVLALGAAGFHTVVQICAVWSDSADVYNFILQDEDDAVVVPDLATGNNIEIKGDNEISPFASTHGAAGDNSGSPPDNPVFHTQAVNKALEVDITGGAGVEKLVIFLCFWYEVIP